MHLVLRLRGGGREDFDLLVKIIFRNKEFTI